MRSTPSIVSMFVIEDYNHIRHITVKLLTFEFIVTDESCNKRTYHVLLNAFHTLDKAVKKINSDRCDELERVKQKYFDVLNDQVEITLETMYNEHKTLVDGEWVDE